MFIIVLLARKSLPAMCGKIKKKREERKDMNEERRERRKIYITRKNWGFAYSLLFNVSAWVINEYMNGRNCLRLFKGV